MKRNGDKRRWTVQIEARSAHSPGGPVGNLSVTLVFPKQQHAVEGGEDCRDMIERELGGKVLSMRVFEG